MDGSSLGRRCVTLTPKQLAEKLQRIRQHVIEFASLGVLEAAELIKEEAKSYIGHQQDNWPDLAESTLAEKERSGYEVPAPLLRKGELRESIKVRHEGLQAVIGTDDPSAAIHEHGNEHVPPRPFLHPALFAKSKEVRVILQKAVQNGIRKALS